MRGWRYESHRHSLAARGIRSSYYVKQGFINRAETRLGRLETVQIEQKDAPKHARMKEYWKSRWGELMDQDSAWIVDENGALVEKREILKKMFGDDERFLSKKYFDKFTPPQQVVEARFKLKNIIDEIKMNKRRQREILKYEPVLSEREPSNEELGEEFAMLEEKNAELREKAKRLSDVINPEEEEQFMAKKVDPEKKRFA